RRLAEAVLERHCTPEQEARARYLAGVALVRIAEQSADQSAQQAYRRAREFLKQALAHGVPEHDEPRLHFALAQSCLHLGDPPAAIIEQLDAALPDGTDKPAEGYALLAQQYLRSNPPDVDGALDANMKLLNRP